MRISDSSSDVITIDVKNPTSPRSPRVTLSPNDKMTYTEMMRVNIRYKYQLTQAEIIALALIGIGVLLMLFAKKLNPKPEINY